MDRFDIIRSQSLIFIASCLEFGYSILYLIPIYLDARIDIFCEQVDDHLDEFRFGRNLCPAEFACADRTGACGISIHIVVIADISDTIIIALIVVESSEIIDIAEIISRLCDKGIPEILIEDVYGFLRGRYTVLAFAGIEKLGEIVTGNSFFVLDVLDGNVHIFEVLQKISLNEKTSTDSQEESERNEKSDSFSCFVCAALKDFHQSGNIKICRLQYSHS